jgi:alanine racemase
MKNHIDKPQLFINLAHFRYNYHHINKITKGSKVIGVVKGDGYGHGMIKCSDVLLKAGCKSLYVANIEESIKLRKNFKKANIYVLSGAINKNEFKILDKYKITPIINNYDQLEIAKDFSSLNNKKTKAVIHIDTGMNRLGFKPKDMLSKDLFKKIDIEFLMSHFTSADEKDKKNCNKQLAQLLKINEKFNSKLSIANSSGSFLDSKYHLNYVRPGKSLYGMNPFKKETFNLKQVASLYAPIIQTSFADKNETIGYGKTYRAKQKIKTATINFGYANGYLRQGSNRASTFINNIETKVLGRISMDLITIDVSNVPDKFLHLGYPVEILGKNASYEKVSQALGTHELETLISIGFGTQKKYLS